MAMSVLVIDDNDSSMDMIIYILQSLGVVVTPALNGPAGLAIARMRASAMIVCDIQMPHLDGYGVLAALKSDPQLSDIPIVAITTIAKAGDEKRLLNAGFDGYLGKPINIDDVKTMLRRFFPEWVPR